MKRFTKMAVGLAALALTVAATGCTPEQKAMIQQYCQQNPAQCADLLKTLTDITNTTPPPAPGTVTAEALQYDDIPQALRDWASTQTNEPTPAYSVITIGDNSYCALAGGLKPTGGYATELTDVSQKDGAWVISARVIPPAPGTIVTMHLENPMAFYRMPKLTGQVNVQWAPEVTKPGGEMPVRDLINATWADGGILHVTGQADVADVHLEAAIDGKVVAQADAQVKDGQFESNLIVPGGPATLTLTVSTVEPGGGTVIQTKTVSGNRGPIPSDQYWSANFRVAKPRQTDATHILVEGAARAFEAVFRVEVWADGKMLANQAIHASEGAPAFGKFSASVEVAGGVPRGAEVRFIIDSPKDGTPTVEVTAPVAPVVQTW